MPDCPLLRKGAGYFLCQPHCGTKRRRTEKGNDGIAVWKFYSSGFIVKTPLMVLAFDLSAGYPVKDNLNSKLRFTENQIKMAADLIDCSFHTHEHPDHISFKLTKELCKRGKKVVVTESNKKLWTSQKFSSELLTVEDFKSLIDFPYKFYAYNGWQRMQEGRELDVPCLAFCVELRHDLRIMVKGDIFDGDDWGRVIAETKNANIAPTHILSGLHTATGKDILSQSRRAFNPVFIPAHEWEFSHRVKGGAGAATQTYASVREKLEESLKENKAIIMFWGEKINL